ncbi:MAG TPA: type II secretion system F family protein [Caulobacteraceae bacterium]|jgi:general secretion pathway protein F|nr:type II secretion system F family protein [Caulobacteraceae bacterium]
MATFRYRAATSSGALRSGVLDGESRADVIGQLLRMGMRPIEAVATSATADSSATVRLNGQTRQAMVNAIGELAVLLQAGLALDRALTVCVGNIPHAGVKATFDKLLARVKEGEPLSRAMAASNGFFPPMASAMCEAGEADGRLGVALARLAETLDRAEALRQSVVSSLVYPALLLVVATSVILVMLLVVVPQFEGLFAGAKGKLPLATRVVMATSEGVRAFGLQALAGIAAAVFALRAWLKRPSVRLSFDRLILGVPQLGGLIRSAETAAFARTLGSLVDGGVPLPMALGIAERSVSNTHMTGAIAKVAAGVKQGGGLSGPLAASGVFPPMALSFLRTGEETAQLGLMLGRLADVLDRSVRSTTERMLAVLTPAITVVMGAIVATVIASIMSAILGFNDLALAP